MCPYDHGLDDLAKRPCPADGSGNPIRKEPAWAQLIPRSAIHGRNLDGGPDAYLALASFGLPLGLAMLLQLIAPGAAEPC